MSDLNPNEIKEKIRNKVEDLMYPASQDKPKEHDGSENGFFESYGYKIILALRRITHAVDAHSKKLSSNYHITGPQLLCLYTIVKEESTTLSKISKINCLSVSTVNGIIDRLESKGLIERHRDTVDKRKVLLKPTEAGLKLASNAPLLLHDKLAHEIQKLPDLEQATIAFSLERIVKMMNPEDVDQ